MARYQSELDYLDELVEQRSEYPGPNYHNKPKADRTIPVGEEIVCPLCEITFRKKRIDQIFCCVDCNNLWSQIVPPAPWRRPRR